MQNAPTPIFKPRAVLRRVPLGDNDFLEVEMALVPLGEAQGVLLKEPTPATSARQGLTGAFEYVATVLGHELVHMRRTPAALRFFHVRYEMRPTGTPRWAPHEVMVGGSGAQAGAHWRAVDTQTLSQLIEALNCWGLPQRKLR